MNRSSFGRLVLFAALTAIAALALPGLAAAKAKDRNHDRIPDRWEKRHHLSLKVDQAGRDQDRDNLDNRAEFLAGDNPRDADSDNDGIEDGEENAGKIQSFDPQTGRLTIALFGGETVSGLVTEGTRIKCEDGHSAAMTSSDGGKSEPGDDNGGQGEAAGEDRGEEPGDDRGEEEPGEDHGGDNSGPGSQNPGPGNPGEGDEAECTTADLVAGTVVEEAGLELRQGVATFEEVELAG